MEPCLLRTFLGQDDRFTIVPHFPEFCWTEMVMNSVAHRDYSILGTDIHVKIFDDHLTVENSGILLGLPITVLTKLGRISSKLKANLTKCRK